MFGIVPVFAVEELVATNKYLAPLTLPVFLAVKKLKNGKVNIPK